MKRSLLALPLVLVLAGSAAPVGATAPAMNVTYATYLGGSDSDLTLAADIATDDAGNMYVVSSTRSDDFPMAGTPFRSSRSGADDAVVAKISADGSTLVWSTYFGGSGIDYARDIAVDDDGNVIIVGMTYSADLPLVAAFDTTPPTADLADVFVAKFAADGSSLVYSSFLGGGKQDGKPNLALDAAGNAWVGGYSHSRGSFPQVNPLPGRFDGAEYNGPDAFVSKVSSSGALLSSTLFGGLGPQSVRGIAVDADGAPVFSGFTGQGLPTVRAAQPAHGGRRDAFVAKLTPAGDDVVFSTYWGGSETDGPYYGPNLGLDPSGNAFVTAYTKSTDLPTRNAAQPAHGGGTFDAAVAAYAPTGAQLFSTYLGGNANDDGHSLAVDATGRAWVTGYTRSANFPRVDAIQPALVQGSDLFVTRFELDGTISFSTNVGGVRGAERGYGITTGPGGVFVVGSAGGSDFPLVAPLQSVPGGGRKDLLIVRLSEP